MLKTKTVMKTTKIMMKISEQEVEDEVNKQEVEVEVNKQKVEVEFKEMSNKRN